jgi:hypothetical protein
MYNKNQKLSLIIIHGLDCCLLFFIFFFIIDKKRTTKKKVNSILISRELECNEVKVLRIIDFIGDCEQLSEIGNAIEAVMNKNDYEYVDFYLGGLKLDAIEKAGFKLKTDDDLNCIPNYFEPFIQENISLHYFTTSEKDFLIFKGDGDQDRPNFIPNCS